MKKYKNLTKYKYHFSYYFIMKIMYNNAHIRTNFLEFAASISNEESKALIDYDNTLILKEKLEEYCTEAYPFEKVVLLFHRYACIAYLSAEFIKNAKIYLDDTKKDFILLSFIKESEPDAVSIVYSNIKSLSQYPAFPITVKDIISFLEEEDVLFCLRNFYLKNVQ